jgi:hypothetical protein
METAKIPEFKFGGPEIGAELVYRAYAQEMRTKIEPFFGKAETVICDFKGIETISESFADECFGKLFENRKDGDVSTGIKFLNASPLITTTIGKAVMKRLQCTTWPI